MTRTHAQQRAAERYDCDLSKLELRRLEADIADGRAFRIARTPIGGIYLVRLPNGRQARAAWVDASRCIATLLPAGRILKGRRKIQRNRKPEMRLVETEDVELDAPIEAFNDPAPCNNILADRLAAVLQEKAMIHAANQTPIPGEGDQSCRP